jgi:hypothetical protein
MALMRPLVRSLAATLGLALLVASCADLFDDAIQCKTDGDCAEFEAVCDVPNGVCIKSRGAPGDDGGSSGTVTPPEETDSAPTEDQNTPFDKCAATPKQPGTVGTKIDAGVAARGEITGAVTLGCEKDWVLDALVFVRAGATLTIEAGTTIKAKKGTGAGIVVQVGGRVIADGLRDKPIVFTSGEAAAPAPGDWRGIYVLGGAPPTGAGPYDDDPELTWGGAKLDDDSGSFSFVRIEYARAGIVFAGVGSKTKLDFIQVRKTVENCFMFNGGRVDSKHLVCQFAGDDQFEWYEGYVGRAQFLFGQKAALPPAFNSGGLLVDDSQPKIFNATICGDRPAAALNGYGVLFRDNGTLDLNSAIISGWRGGLDATGLVPNPGGVRGSIFFQNAQNPAFAEDPDDPDMDSPTFDDDNGYNELGEIAAATPANALTNPGLVDCFEPKNPQPWPAAAITTNAVTPPGDGFFDVNAKYVGAFKDATDSWMKGAWVRFDDK